MAMYEAVAAINGSLLGEGRNNIQATIDFPRWCSGLDQKLKAFHSNVTSILPAAAASDLDGRDRDLARDSPRAWQKAVRPMAET